MNLHFNNTVMVSDPCYDKDVWCLKVVDDVLPGEYTHRIEIVDAGSWGDRVDRLIVCHKDYDFEKLSFEVLSNDIGVDSGEAGFFDYDMFCKVTDKEESHDLFGDECYGLCVVTRNEIAMHTDNQGGVLASGLGLVCNSGFGDGAYTLYGARNDDGKIVAMYIDFEVIIGDEDEDDEE